MIVILMGLQELKAQVLNSSNSKDDTLDTGDDTQIETEMYQRSDWQKIDINFLNSYYSQDGNNGAVTGGIGTEQLTDFTQKISISIPTNPRFKLNIDGAYDYYSSASTDNIDNIRSSDSSSDVRSQFGVGFEYTKNEQWTVGMRLGTSFEYDYASVHLGGNALYTTKSQNTSIGLSAQAFVDRWEFYFPVELRGKVSLPTQNRQSYNASLSINQVMTRRLQMSFMLESTFMNGLLSTPFHRVYFQNETLPDIERLPSQRLKVPIGARANYYLSDWLLMRAYYRYYWDDWGMTGHTASLELPIKLNRFFAIYPHYRYHTQNAIDYFAPYEEHLSSTEFYTSDFDLSALESHTYGVGILYSPSGSIGKMKIPLLKDKHITFDGIDLKASVYNRSTGLNGYIISLGLKFGI